MECIKMRLLKTYWKVEAQTDPVLSEGRGRGGVRGLCRPSSVGKGEYT